MRNIWLRFLKRPPRKLEMLWTACLKLKVNGWS
jgi:hypothetical protein